MKYDDRYPEIVKRYRVRVAEFRLPYEPEFLKAMEPIPGLEFTGRYFPCFRCAARTGWVESETQTHACSEECLGEPAKPEVISPSGGAPGESPLGSLPEGLAPAQDQAAVAVPELPADEVRPVLPPAQESGTPPAPAPDAVPPADPVVHEP